MKNKMLNIAVAVVLAAGMYVPAFAQTTSTNASIQTQLQMIQQLTQQIQNLQTQLNALRAQRTTATIDLVRTLKLGDASDQVTALQALLAADAGVYPEGLITGYFGRATEHAVKRFQQKKGLPQVGRVGPLTLERLREELQANPLAIEPSTGTGGASGGTTTSTSGRPCAIVPPGHLIAPGWLRHHDGIAPIVPACQTLPPGIARQLGLGGGTTTPPTPDVTPPVISTVVASNLTPTSAAVTWTTNEAANSKAYYGTTNPLNLATALTVMDSALLTSHSLNLAGLTANTTYYIVVQSADAANNTATSSQSSFITPAVPDTTAPVISAITIGNITSAGASVSWTTDEAATTNVHYGTSSPLILASAPSIGNTALVTAHSVALTGFTASTTYYLVLESKDAANNTATSSQQSFVTLP